MILITTVGKDLSLLEKFIEYYSRFDFKEYGFLINNEDYENIIQIINNVFKKCDYFPRTNFKRFEGEFTESKKVQYERIFLEETNYYEKYGKKYLKEKWIIYSDLDEFIHIPGGIENRIKLAEMYGVNYIEGLMVDRISEDGTLKEYDSSKPLEEQFPIGCNITKNICNGWDKKIIAAKYNVMVGGGHHVIMNDRKYNETYDQPYKEEISPWSFGIEIHHFKWNSKLFEKFECVRNTTNVSLESWRREYQKWYDFYTFGKKCFSDVNDLDFYTYIHDVRNGKYFKNSNSFFDEKHLIKDFWIGSKLGI